MPQVAPYRAAFKKAEDRWGQQVIHENVKIARVADLELKVRLQRAFTVAARPTVGPR